MLLTTIAVDRNPYKSELKSAQSTGHIIHVGATFNSSRVKGQ